MASGLKGEAHLKNDVWFVKSHFPSVSPNVGAGLKVKKAVVIVRNPIDVMMSYL
jgi:hypothetical protein